MYLKNTNKAYCNSLFGNPWYFNPAIQPFSYRVEYLLIISLKYDVTKFDFLSVPQKPHARIYPVLNANENIKSAIIYIIV